MVLKADQERVKTLLKDTITLLCRNGLTFKSKFSIEALIGVTLDDNDVFLVSINELIQTEKAHEEEQEKEAENTSGVDSPLAASEGSRERKRRWPHVKTEVSQSGNEDHGDDDSVASSHGDNEPQSPPAEPAAKRQMDLNTMKQEVNEDSEDIVFIKEEPKDTVWQEGQTESLFSDMTNAANSSLGNDQNFPSLADMNLIPVASQEENTLWTTSQANQMMAQVQQRGYRPRGPRTSTVTVGSMGDGQPGGQSSQDNSQIDVGSSERVANDYFCEICGKSFTWKHSFIRHQNSHLGKYPHNCRFCQKGFMNRFHLEGHEAKHLGITNLYRCTICFKVFSFSSGLQYHIKSVHES